MTAVQYFTAVLAIWFGLALSGGIWDGVIMRSADLETMNAMGQVQEITAPSSTGGFAPLRWVGATSHTIGIIANAVTLQSSFLDNGFGTIVRLALGAAFGLPLLFILLMAAVSRLSG